VRTQFVLELKEAEAAVAAGHARAAGNGWTVSVAVVDAAGTPILVSRMNAASPASVNTAIEKARTSAMLGLPTKVVEAIVKDRPALLSMDRVAVEGGVPILFQGQKLGGIGVSGVQSHEDSQVAEAGLAALTPLLG
jgi:glc operon protein GlcG